MRHLFYEQPRMSRTTKQWRTFQSVLKHSFQCRTQPVNTCTSTHSLKHCCKAASPIFDISTGVEANPSLTACSHCRQRQDKTVLSCPCRRCEHNWRQDKTRQFCLVSTKFPTCNCSVSNILRITENLEIGNWVETRQNCLVLSAVVFTPPMRTRQDSLVLSVGGVNKLLANQTAGYFCRRLSHKPIMCLVVKLYTLTHKPSGSLPLLSVRTTVTFPATQHHCPLANEGGWVSKI